MWIAKEGLREIGLAALVLGVPAAVAVKLFWPAAIPFIVAWLWVLSFFRDPNRTKRFVPGELCSPADGTVTEITELDHHDTIGGPAIRIGVFLSLFNVHINRSPCSGWIRSLVYRDGEFLDARHPESGTRNESNTLVVEPDGGLPGPVVVRQVAGLVARRIICNVALDQYVPIAARIGLIKFGSRTELIIPRVAGTEVSVKVGDRVYGALTVMARQPVRRPGAAPTVATDESTAPAALSGLPAAAHRQ